jgi:hypothetical protein
MSNFYCYAEKAALLRRIFIFDHFIKKTSDDISGRYTTMLNAIMLSVIMLNVFMLNVIMLSIVSP